MFLNWTGMLADLKTSVGELARRTPQTRDGYRLLHAAGGEKKLLDPKTRELIALAVAVTTRCDGCIANHTKKAIELGVSQDEIAEALGVAVAMNAGAALAYSARVMDAYSELSRH
ncbi:carboxymuconolactone decarboxylase family protein [Alsobacter sp. SYSU BS001988]